MASRPKSTPSLQALRDTYHYLVRGLKGESGTTPSPHATATARHMMVPVAVRREMVQTLRTLPSHLEVIGLSSASVRVNERLFLLSPQMQPFAHTDEEELIPLSIEAAGSESHDGRDRWHRWLYANSNAQAVLMVHPAAAIACATRGVVPTVDAFPAAASKINQVQRRSPDVATWRTAVTEGAVLLISDGTLIPYADTLAAAIAHADIVSRWCEAALRTQ